MLRWITLGALLASSAISAENSVCYGTTGNGRLEDGAQLPERGPNFTAYSSLGASMGRNYVHSKVKDIVVAAYGALEASVPGRVFVYGETGWEAGGRIRPHKTHQNGLSVDFMVPVVRDGTSVPLPTTVFNKFGYDLEFDDSGRLGGYSIDFEAMAAHLRAIKAAADSRSVKVSRVIFEVSLQAKLFASTTGVGLNKILTFSTKPAWVRHDEHYHIDFDVPCRALVSSST